MNTIIIDELNDILISHYGAKRGIFSEKVVVSWAAARLIPKYQKSEVLSSLNEVRHSCGYSWIYGEDVIQLHSLVGDLL